MSKEDKAKQQLKQLQAQINGMRLALATACTTCEVDAVISLLKTISNGVAEAIKYLDIESCDLEESKEIQSPELENTTEIEKDIPEDGNYQSSEMYKQIDALLNKSVESTMDLTKAPELDDEMPEQDVNAMMSLVNLMNQQQKDQAEKTEAKVEDLLPEQKEEKKKTKSSLEQIPISFNLQNQDPEEYINGRN